MLSFSEIIGEEHVELYWNFATILQQLMKFMDRDFFENMEYSQENFFLPAILRVTNLLMASKDTSLEQKAEELQRAAANLFPVHDTDLMIIDMDDDDDDDSQGLVVVPYEEYEALTKASPLPVLAHPLASNVTYSGDLRSKYPILFASMQPHEDLLILCARALDTKLDVSLVREAAAYLQEVEAYNVTQECGKRISPGGDTRWTLECERKEVTW